MGVEVLVVLHGKINANCVVFPTGRAFFWGGKFFVTFIGVSARFVTLAHATRENCVHTSGLALPEYENKILPGTFLIY